MKRILAVLTCLCCGSAVLADEVTWTGGASGIWEVGDNWSTGSMPGGVHPLKFAPGVGSVSFYHLGGRARPCFCGS